MKQIKDTWLLDLSNFGFRIEWDRSFQFHCSNALHSFQSLNIKSYHLILNLRQSVKIFCLINNRRAADCGLFWERMEAQEEKYKLSLGNAPVRRLEKLGFLVSEWLKMIWLNKLVVHLSMLERVKLNKLSFIEKRCNFHNQANINSYAYRPFISRFK